MRLTELNRSVYRTGWHSMLSIRNDDERGLFVRPTMTNTISYYTDSYINIGHSYTNFSTSQLYLFNCNFVNL